MLSVCAPEGIYLDGVLLFTMTLQKILLGNLLVVATFMTVCNAECYVIPLEKVPIGSRTECKDLYGVTHPLKSRWRTFHCDECYCEENEITCCKLAPIPVGYDRTLCRVTFHRKNCTYSVTEHRDPGKACVVHSWVL